MSPRTLNEVEYRHSRYSHEEKKAPMDSELFSSTAVASHFEPEFRTYNPGRGVG